MIVKYNMPTREAKELVDNLWEEFDDVTSVVQLLSDALDHAIDLEKSIDEAMEANDAS